jgi:hypothetical protein
VAYPQRVSQFHWWVVDEGQDSFMCAHRVLDRIPLAYLAYGLLPFLLALILWRTPGMEVKYAWLPLLVFALIATAYQYWGMRIDPGKSMYPFFCKKMVSVQIPTFPWWVAAATGGIVAFRSRAKR